MQVAGESYSWLVFCHFCNLYLKFLFTAQLNLDPDFDVHG